MESKKLVLLGGGGHCKSVLDAIIRNGEYEDIVITDPIIPVGTRILNASVVGSDEMIPVLFRDGYHHAFVTVGGIGNSKIRKKLSTFAESVGFEFPVIADPSAQISKSVTIGGGTFIGKNAVINAYSYIGNHCIINTGSIIEHECEIGDYSHISVGTILCGDCRVGTKSFIGAGSTVIQGIDIGHNVIVGANSTVLADVEDNMKIYGIVKQIRGGNSLISIFMSFHWIDYQEVA